MLDGSYCGPRQLKSNGSILLYTTELYVYIYTVYTACATVPQINNIPKQAKWIVFVIELNLPTPGPASLHHRTQSMSLHGSQLVQFSTKTHCPHTFSYLGMLFIYVCYIVYKRAWNSLLWNVAESAGTIKNKYFLLIIDGAVGCAHQRQSFISILHRLRSVIGGQWHIQIVRLIQLKHFFYFSNHFKKVQNTLLYKVIDIKFVLKSVMMSPKHLCLILIRKMLLAQNPPKTLAINFGFFSLTIRKLKIFRNSLTGPHSVMYAAPASIKCSKTNQNCCFVYLLKYIKKMNILRKRNVFSN